MYQVSTALGQRAGPVGVDARRPARSRFGWPARDPGRVGGHRLHLGQPLVRRPQLGLQVHDPALQLDHQLLQLDDPLDAGQVHPVVLAQPLDLAQQHHVAHAVAAAAAGGPAGLDQPHPVVLAQGLRVHAGHPRRHRDDQHLGVVRTVDSSEELARHPGHLRSRTASLESPRPSRRVLPRRRAASAAANSSSALRASADSVVGTYDVDGDQQVADACRRGGPRPCRGPAAPAARRARRHPQGHRTVQCRHPQVGAEHRLGEA